MATLLEMVNKFRRRIRHDTVTAISTTDQVTDLAVDMINESARELFGNYLWNWLRYDDGIIKFPAPVSTLSPTEFPVINDASIVNDSTSHSLVINTNPLRDSILDNFAANNVVSVFRVTDDANYPDTTWKIDWMKEVSGSDISMESVDNYAGTTNADAEFIMNSNEYVLPITVQRVLTVRHMERPLTLEFVNKTTDFDLRVPRPLDTGGDPEVAVVGNIATTTNLFVTGPGVTVTTTGPSIVIWPVPESAIILRYSYIKRHVDLSSDSDEFAAVPDLATNYIVWDSVAKYWAGPGNDQDRFKSVEFANRNRLFQLRQSDTQDPTRRNIARPYDHRGIGNARRRWETQTIPEPS